MAATLDNSSKHTTTGQVDSLQQRTREERMEENDSKDTRAGDSQSSIKVSEGPKSNSVHRVADMLKEKINNRNRDEDIALQESAAARDALRSFSDVTRPYLTPMMPAPVKGLGNSPNGCDSSVQDFALAMSRHHLSMMGNEALTPDSAKVLRGILQGKEATDGRHDGSVITKLLQQDREQQDTHYLRNGEFDVNDSDGDSFPRSGSPGGLSTDDSDQENNMNGANGPEDLQDEGLKRKLMDISEENSIDGSVVSGGDTNEAKRARVENIINRMNTSPDKPEGASAEVRRPSKRKQYIPQQHGHLEQSSPKVKKVEKGILQKQLKQMQEQLAVMQQKYMELFDQESSEQSELSDIAESSEMRKLSKYSRDFDAPKKFFENSDADPSLYIKQASELVREQAKLAALAKQVSPTRGDTPADLQGLAKMLKAEITNSVGTLVDTVVSKFAERQKKKDGTKASLSMNELGNKEKPSESTPVKPSSPATASDRNTPKPPRTKVTDKIPHPLFDNPPRGMFLDVPRAHLPLFPPPPYFPHAQVPTMQPLYAKEPEQTEALPLVVNTPKKKRTKVTDTRLSPRAARALLQESLQQGPHGPKGMSLHHSPHGPEPFPPHPHVSSLVPSSLPTSVAIPNPSLQHSEVLWNPAGEHHLYPDAPRGSHHSPSNSPSMGHTPGEGMNMSMVKAESEQAFDHPMGEGMTYDGTHAMISFLAKKFYYKHDFIHRIYWSVITFMVFNNPVIRLDSYSQAVPVFMVLVPPDFHIFEAIGNFYVIG